MSNRTVLGLAGTAMIAILWIPLLGHGQACAGGRVVTERTQGRCCWPGQAWSGTHCEGPPSCPAGYGASGDECIPVASAPAPWADPNAPTYGSPAAAPGYGYVPGTARAAYPGSLDEGGGGPSVGLTVTGAVLFGAGYLTAVGFGVAWFMSPGAYYYSRDGYSGYDNSCEDAVAGLHLIPIVGSIIGAIMGGTCTVLRGSPAYRGPGFDWWIWLEGFATGAFQIVGFSLFLAGLTRGGGSSAGLELERGVVLQTGAPGSPLGLTLRVEAL